MSRGNGYAKALGLQPGEYDQRVTVHRDSPGTNADGQRVEAGAALMRRWAKVEPYGGNEREGNQQQHADVTHRVYMRSDRETRAITPKDWLVLRDGTRLDITRTYDRDLRRVEIVMECNQRT